MLKALLERNLLQRSVTSLSLYSIFIKNIDYRGSTRLLNHSIRLCGCHNGNNFSKRSRKMSSSNQLSSNVTPSRKRHSTDKSLTQHIIGFMPKSEPYLNLVRFDRPIGTWLLFLPCSWSISLAAEPGHFPDLKMLALFGTGSILLRSAGCVINDMWDAEFDRKVERTKTRPLAARDLSKLQALGFLGGILSCGLMILLSLNWYSVVLGASSMALVVLYPLAKRFTYWPQVVLGATFNWGALLGWSAVKGGCDWSVVLPLYLACVSWTMTYDTIYAHQDKEDDALIGVKSTALLFKDKTVSWLGIFSVIMVTNLTAAGFMANQTWPYFAAVAGVSAHLLWQVTMVDLDNVKDCGSKFKSNKWLGLILLSGIIAGNVIQEEKPSDSKSDPA